MQVSRFKVRFERPFEAFLQRHYAEHARRIVGLRSQARGVLFLYPALAACVCVVPPGILTVAASVLYDQNPPWFERVATPETANLTLPALYALTAGAAVVGFLGGLALGLARSRSLIFESEKVEISARQVYFTRALARASRRRKRLANTRISVGRDPRISTGADHSTSSGAGSVSPRNAL